MFRKIIIDTYKKARRVIMIVFGFTFLIIGIIMVVLPGPGFPIVLLALTILAAEFVWAKRLLRRVQETVDRIPFTRKVSRFFSQLWFRTLQLFSH